MSAGPVVPDAGGCRVTVHVVPKASKSELAGLHGDAIRVRLNAPPVDGKANKALCAFLAETLGVPARSVELVAGETSRRKILRLPVPAPDAARVLGVSLC